MEFTTRVLRPHDKLGTSGTYTPTNLTTYFEMARDVLFDAGGAIRNSDFDPEIPYSEEIMITHPERIRSYDETKVELDCTRAGASKRDPCIREVRFPDDGGRMP